VDVRDSALAFHTKDDRSFSGIGWKSVIVFWTAHDRAPSNLPVAGHSCIPRSKCEARRGLRSLRFTPHYFMCTANVVSRMEK
jgi:hypothetical protein